MASYTAGVIGIAIMAVNGPMAGLSLPRSSRTGPRNPRLTYSRVAAALGDERDDREAGL